MGEGLEYWARWQVPVCALVIILPAIVASVMISKVTRPRLSASHLWVPCWRGLSPVWLLAYRALVFCFMSILLCVVASHEGAFVFYFYTQWTFTLVIVYFALGTGLSAHGCWVYKKTPTNKNGEGVKFLRRDPDENQPKSTLNPEIKNDGDTNTLQRQDQKEGANEKAGFLGYLMQIIYQTCAGAVMLTDIVFWCLLVPFQLGDDFKVSLLIGCMHSVNLLFLLLDTALNNIPFPWFGMTYFVLWSCTYIVFQWLLHICGLSWWPYPFLELSDPWAPMWYLGVALVHVPCYGFYVLIVKAKNTIFSKVFPAAYLRSSSL